MFSSDFLNVKFFKKLIFNRLFELSAPLQVVNAETSASAREDLYLMGGCFSVTSRILIVDLLLERIPMNLISGFLISNAHDITDTCTDAFILNLFREKNKSGFIRALTDSPSDFFTGIITICYFCNFKGNKMERLLKTLFVKNVYLWPRFHLKVLSSLEVSPHVIEIKQPMSSSMLEISQIIFNIQNSLLKLVKGTSNVISLDSLLFTSSWKLDTPLYNLSKSSRSAYNSIMHLHKVMLCLMKMDCICFYRFLLTFREEFQHEGWINTPLCDSLFRVLLRLLDHCISFIRLQKVEFL